MRRLLDHSSDRGESADRFGVAVNSIVFTGLMIALVIWFFKFPIF